MENQKEIVGIEEIKLKESGGTKLESFRKRLLEAKIEILKQVKGIEASGKMGGKIGKVYLKLQDFEKIILWELFKRNIDIYFSVSQKDNDNFEVSAVILDVMSENCLCSSLVIRPSTISSLQDDCQKIGSMLTYARRYLYKLLFHIDLYEGWERDNQRTSDSYIQYTYRNFSKGEEQ